MPGPPVEEKAASNPDHASDEGGAPVPSATLDTLARAVGHAINNPLAALLANLDGVIELLRRDPCDAATRVPKALALLEDVRSAADRIAVVVQGLRTKSATPPTHPAREVSPQIDEPTASARRRFRVLVVDDDEMVRTALRRCLRDYDVVTADAARGAAARLASGERFDVIFCDLMMPEMTGMDLFDEVTRLAPEQAQKIVFLTGGAVTARAREFVDVVPNLVIEKPFETQKLRDVIRSRLTASVP